MRRQETPTDTLRHLMSWILCILVMAVACTRDPSPRPGTQRERDSVLGASELPGAQGVRGALRAQDSAAARNARLDSGQPLSLVA